jgi:hypothetical protein
MHTYAKKHPCSHTYIQCIHTYNAYIHTYMHTYVHTQMVYATWNTNAHIRRRTSLFTYIRTYIHTYIHTLSMLPGTQIHTYAAERPYIHACIVIDIYMHSVCYLEHKCTHTLQNILVHIHTYNACTHTYIRTTHTYIHTHTHGLCYLEHKCTHTPQDIFVHRGAIEEFYA